VDLERQLAVARAEDGSHPCQQHCLYSPKGRTRVSVHCCEQATTCAVGLWSKSGAHRQRTASPTGLCRNCPGWKTVVGGSGKRAALNPTLYVTLVALQCKSYLAPHTAVYYCILRLHTSHFHKERSGTTSPPNRQLPNRPHTTTTRCTAFPFCFSPPIPLAYRAPYTQFLSSNPLLRQDTCAPALRACPHANPTPANCPGFQSTRPKPRRTTTTQSGLI